MSCARVSFSAAASRRPQSRSSSAALWTPTETRCGSPVRSQIAIASSNASVAASGCPASRSTRPRLVSDTARPLAVPCHALSARLSWNISRARSRSPRKWYTPPRALSASAIPAGSPRRRLISRLSVAKASAASRSPLPYAFVPSALRTSAIAGSSNIARAIASASRRYASPEPVVTLERGQQARAAERLAVDAGRRVHRHRQGGRQPEPALRVVPPRAPELGERAGEAKRERAVALVHRPLEGLTDVVVRLIEAVERLDVATRRERRLGLLGHGQDLVGVRPAHRDGLPASGKPVQCVGANGRQHRERPALVLVPEQRCGGQLLEARIRGDPERREPAALATLEHRVRRRDGERARDHRHAPVQPQHRVGQQPDAPVHRGPQAALPCRPRRRVVARIHGLVGQALVELVRELVRREDMQGGGGQLDRQRDPVEAPADRRGEGGIGRGRLDLRAADRGPGEEQGDRRVAHELGGIGLVRGGNRERFHPHDALARDTDRDPARGQDGQPGRPGEEVGQGGRGRADVFDRVEDEHARGAAERLGERLNQRPPRLVGDAHRPGDGGHDQRRVTHPVERHERDPTVPPRHRAARQLDGQAALAHATDPRQRDERPVPPEDQAPDGGEVRVATDQRRIGRLGHGAGPARVDRRIPDGGRRRGRCVRDRRGGGLGISRRVHRGPEHTPGIGSACRGSGCRRGPAGRRSGGSAAPR